MSTLINSNTNININTSINAASLLQKKQLNSQNFIEFAIAQNVLLFGEFKTKAHRLSPYFFNAGLFNDGLALWQLGQFYAQTIIEKNIVCDGLFGPAYKGISLAAVTACALATMGKQVKVTFNRKEIKDHGEGGNLIGAPLQGNILIIDDVISAGTSIKQSIELISPHANISGVLIALDRMEKSGDANTIGKHTASQHLKNDFNLEVYAIAQLNDLIAYVENLKNNTLQIHTQAIKAYQAKYCLI